MNNNEQGQTMSRTFEAGKIYINKYGFRVFPVHGLIGGFCSCGNPACSNAGKHPATPHGFKNAASEVSALESLFGYDAKTNTIRKGYCNIGIATGAESKIFVLDIDGVDGESELMELEKEHGKLPETLTAKTGSGRHLFFKYPEGVTISSRAKKFSSNLDIRGEGGYVVAPPSMHKSGVEYQLLNPNIMPVDAPQWVIDRASESRKSQPAVRAVMDTNVHEDRKFTVDEVEEMLSYIPSDCTREEWLHIGMALHEGGYPMSVWNRWSANAPHRYNEHDLVKDWNSFKPGGGITMGTLVHKAQTFGWKPIAYQEHISLDDHPARDFLLSIGAIEQVEGTPPAEPIKADKLLTDPLKLPGLIGDTIRTIYGLCVQPQPELFMMNVIAALGAVYGRRYALEGPQGFDTRTNIYTVGVAPTGSGKDISRKIMLDIMDKAGMRKFIGSNKIISDTGLRREIKDQPSLLLQIDEFGMIIESFYGTNAAPHLRTIIPLFCELYSSSNSISKGGRYADVKAEPIDLRYPNLCIYGTTTLTAYKKALKKEAVLNGDMNRFIIVPVSEEYPEFKDAELTKVPEEIIQQWADLAPAEPQADPMGGVDFGEMMTNILDPTPTPVKIGATMPRIRQMRERQREKLIRYRETTGALWVRYAENCLKIAMIFAITRNKIAPTLTDSDLDIAEGIVTTSVNYASELANHHMFENSYDKDRQEVLEMIRARKQVGIARSELVKQARHVKPKDLDQILFSLLEANNIVAEKEQPVGSGRPAIRYRASIG